MAALNEFVVWMNQKGFSPTTINKRVSYLKRIASFAVENGVKGVSGFFRGLKKPRTEKKRGRPNTVFNCTGNAINHTTKRPKRWFGKCP